MTDSAEQ
jgi:hypothetical protein